MDSGSAIPEGYTSITPYFTVQDADALINFLTAAFSGVLIKEDRNPQNRIQHARIRIDNSVIMINEATDDYAANVSQMHLYVANADEAYKTALTHGATSIMTPNLRPHGDRMAGIKDPCGNIWWIATHSA